MPAASMVPIMLVEQAMTVEKAGTVASMPASISTSRAMLLKVREGTTTPHTAKSGLPPSSAATMWRATGTDSSMASSVASAPSTLANGVRTPAASQMSCGRGIARLSSKLAAAWPFARFLVQLHDLDAPVLGSTLFAVVGGRGSEHADARAAH